MQNILFLSKNFKDVNDKLVDHYNQFLPRKAKFVHKVYSDIEVLLTPNSQTITLDSISLNTFNKVLFRFGQYKMDEISSTLSHYLKSKNLSSINAIHINKYFGGKLLQNVIASINGVNIPRTVYIPTKRIKTKIHFIENNLNYPFIMKSITSHKGKDNYLISSREHLLLIINSTSEKLEFICQEFIPNSFDYRLLVLNKDTIGSAEKRIRQDKKDHRNNIALGGLERFISINNLEQDLSNIAIKMANLFKIDTCGIDIIQSSLNHKYYFLEGNSSPGITLNSTEDKSLYNYLINHE